MRNDFTASGYVLNHTGDKVLFIFHKKLQKWLPPGGHLDPNELPHQAAIREIFEETGVRAELVDVSDDLKIAPGGPESQQPVPLCILYQRIPANAKEEEHMHFDFTYVLTASEQALVGAAREVDDVRWVPLNQVDSYDTFDGVKKICKKIASMSLMRAG